MIVLNKQKQKPSTTISNLFITLIDYLDLDSPLSLWPFVYVCGHTRYRTHVQVEENLPVCAYV